MVINQRFYPSIHLHQVLTVSVFRFHFPFPFSISVFHFHCFQLPQNINGPFSALVRQKLVVAKKLHCTVVVDDFWLVVGLVVNIQGFD